ncbi:MAG: SPOR domain-containing protein [Burkholderiales bacterium]|jgi:lambda repressor-like predicted transcriptional regulator|nr:SPOR domain-containing protein [Burkholderiales bacterium]
MLRIAFLLLILANGVYFAWRQGMLQELGFVPPQQSEPERIAQQVGPQSLRILAPAEAARLEASLRNGQRPAECLQAGLFDDARASALRNALESGWPAGSWTLAAASEPARWMIYMGRYADNEALGRKKAELRQLRILYQTLPNPSLEPGLSLGSFGSQEAADARLAELAQRGVRTARVMQERAEVRGQQLRLPAVDDALRARLDELKPMLAGKTLVPCRA